MEDRERRRAECGDCQAYDKVSHPSSMWAEQRSEATHNEAVGNLLFVVHPTEK